MNREFWKKKITILAVALFVALFICIYVGNVKDITHIVVSDTSADKVFEMESGRCLQQTIQVNTEDDFNELGLIFATYDRENENTITVKFLEKDTLLKSWEIEGKTLKNNEFYYLETESPITLSPSEEYSIEISENYKGENAVGVAGDSEGNLSCSQDGTTSLEGGICYKFADTTIPYGRYIILLFIAVLLLITLALIFNVRERIVMICLLLVGMMTFYFIIPRTETPDCEAHYWRAFEISEGCFISCPVYNEDGSLKTVGNSLPGNISELYNPEAELDYQNLTFQVFINTALYNPATYLPQALGIQIATCFTDKAQMIFDAGRLAGLIVCFILCAAALYFVPFGRKLLFTVMMLPFSLQQLTAFNPDGLVMSLCFFFMAYVLRTAFSERKITWKDMLILSAAAIWISLCKIVYVALLLLLVIIPKRVFRDKKQAMIFKVGLAVIAIILNLIWLKISFPLIVPVRAGISGSGQVHWVLTHLFDYVAVCVRTLIIWTQNWISLMIGQSMGIYCYNVSDVPWIVALMLLLYESCSCSDVPKSKKLTQYIFLLTFLAAAALIFTSLYVQWTAVADLSIDGIQGRYFTPVLPLLMFFAAMSRKNQITESNGEHDVMIPFTLGYYVILFIEMITIIDVLPQVI